MPTISKTKKNNFILQYSNLTNCTKSDKNVKKANDLKETNLKFVKLLFEFQKPTKKVHVQCFSSLYSISK